MKNVTKGKVIKGVAIGIDVLAPLITTICQFPVWVEKSSSATVSGVALLAIFFSCLPFLSQIKEWLKSPSVPVLWVVVLILCVCFRNIIDQLMTICIVGAISNTVGSIVYSIGKSVGAKEDNIGANSV